MEENFNFEKVLQSAVKSGASDEHLKVNHSPYIRKNGLIYKTNLPILTKDMLESILIEIAPQNLKDKILSLQDVDFVYEIKNCSRFRINYSRQIGKPALVIRNIPYKIKTLNELRLPQMLESIVDYQNGIVFITGPTGSGKSTTIASLIDKICSKYAKHIVTIEDPIEFIYSNKKSIVSQRQLGVDTASFSEGIKYALRQDPDVIFIGEIRDRDTLEAALKASETGHLVLTTLHTNDAVQTINRIISMFDIANRDNIRKQLAETLRATVAQKLIYSEKLKMRVPIYEILIATSTIKDYIIKDNLDSIYELLNNKEWEGMISLDESIISLVDEEILTEQEAINAANDKNRLEKFFRGVYQGTKAYYE